MRHLQKVLSDRAWKLGTGHDDGTSSCRQRGIVAVAVQLIRRRSTVRSNPNWTHSSWISLSPAPSPRHERDVVWHAEDCGAMPAGLIEQQHGMRAGGDFGCDLETGRSRESHCAPPTR